VEKYGRARHTTDDSIIRRIHFAYWISKTTGTLRICETYFFQGDNGYANAHHVTFVPTLLVFFSFVDTV
jgi:hypothetical protein